MTITVKRSWCWWYHLTEAGMTVVQVGGLVIELEW